MVSSTPTIDDAYRNWLGIPPTSLPPDYYTLLGLPVFERNGEKIKAATDARFKIVRPRCLRYPEVGSRLLNEIAAANVCLTHPHTKAEYDATLKAGGKSAAFEVGERQSLNNPRVKEVLVAAELADVFVAAKAVEDVPPPPLIQTPPVPPLLVKIEKRPNQAITGQKASVLIGLVVCILVTSLVLAGVIAWTSSPQNSRPGPTTQDFSAQRELADSCDELGDVKLQQGDMAGALAAYEQSFGARLKLAKADPTSTLDQLYLSVSHNKIGDLKLSQGDFKEALGRYEQLLAVSRGLMAADPNNLTYRRNVWLSYGRVGSAKMQQGDLRGAEAAYEEGLGISGPLAVANPHDAQSQHDWWSSHQSLGAVRFNGGHFYKAAEAFEAAIAILEAFQMRTNSMQFADELAQTEELATKAYDNTEATSDAAFIAQQPPETHVELWHWRTKGKCAAKDYFAASEAARSLQGLAEAASSEPHAWATAAGAWALLARSLKEDSPYSGLNPALLEAMALDDLQKAIENGYRDLAAIRSNSDFSALREDRRFQLLIADLKWRGEREAALAPGRPEQNP